MPRHITITLTRAEAQALADAAGDILIMTASEQLGFFGHPATVKAAQRAADKLAAEMYRRSNHGRSGRWTRL